MAYNVEFGGTKTKWVQNVFFTNTLLGYLLVYRQNQIIILVF